MSVPAVTLAERVSAAVARVNAALAETRNPQTILLNRRYTCQRLCLNLPPMTADDEVLFYEEMRTDLEQLREDVCLLPTGAEDDPAYEDLAQQAETYATRLVVWAGIGSLRRWEVSA